MLAWIALALAGLAEIGWAIGLKHTDGWTRLWPSAITIVLMVISVVLLAYAIRTIPVGTGYAVWTGIGAVGVAIVGILTLGESAAPLRLACIGLIALGIVGLKLAGD